jgi:drug/metabolite transporter (DMT)-like permease
MNSRQLSVLLLLGGIWGASFLFIKVVIDGGVNPLGLSLGRTTLGALTLLPVAYRQRASFPRDRRTWLILAWLGFFNFALPWTLFGLAAEHAPSGASSIANSSQPLWAAIFMSILLPGDRLTRGRAVGLFTGFLGVILLMGGDLLHAGSSGSLAILTMLGATFCYGLSAVIIRRWLSHVRALPLAFCQLAFGSLFLLPTAAASGALPTMDMGFAALGCLVALGVVNSGFAVMGYMWLIQQVGPVRAAVVTYLMPPIGVALGWLVLDEPVGWNLLVGLAFVIAGVALVQQITPRGIVRRLIPAATRAAAAASPD